MKTIAIPVEEDRGLESRCGQGNPGLGEAMPLPETQDEVARRHIYKVIAGGHELLSMVRKELKKLQKELDYWEAERAKAEAEAAAHYEHGTADHGAAFISWSRAADRAIAEIERIEAEMDPLLAQEEVIMAALKEAERTRKEMEK